MRKFILGVLTGAAVMAAATSASRAQDYPWCLIISAKNGSWSCYFASREQCMMSAGGNAGFCAQNPAYPAAPGRRQPSGH
jgi:hypothetical protein